MNNNTKPSKLAEKLLIFLSDPSEKNAILGDFREIFSEKESEKGKNSAKFWYWNHLILSFPSFIKWKTLSSLAILRNYIKLGWKNLLKNPTSSFINIAGLSISIGMSMILFVMALDRYGKDTFHENRNEVFLVEREIQEIWGVDIRGDSPIGLGQNLKSDFPQIERVVRVGQMSGTIKYNNNSFSNLIRFADAGFFEMFTFPLLQGAKQMLKDKDSVVLSEKFAKIVFGKKDPIGAQIIINFAIDATDPAFQPGIQNNEALFIVRGIAKDIPQNASFGFDVLLSFDTMIDVKNLNANSWIIPINATFIQLFDRDNISIISSQMNNYIKIENSFRPEQPVLKYIFDPLSEMALNAYDVTDSIGSSVIPRIAFIRFMLGFMLLLLPCFNFINISVAAAGKRLKEIGIRKVVGCRNYQIRLQFIIENLLLCFISVVLGVILCDVFLLPNWNLLANDNLYMNYFDNWRLWVLFASILAFTGIAAGAYPAFYISRFNPAIILQGNQKIKNSNIFSKVLVTFQFVFTFFVISTNMVTKNNINYTRDMDRGYNDEQTIAIHINSKKDFNLLKSEIIYNPFIENIAGTSHHIGRSHEVNEFMLDNINHVVNNISIGKNYFETMELRLMKGSIFNNVAGTNSNDVIINESFVIEMGWLNALGKSFLYNRNTYNVIGVVEDFLFTPPSNDKIRPVYLSLAPEDSYNYMVLKLSKNAGVEVIDFLEETWERLFPLDDFNPIIQKSIFDKAYKENIGEIKAFEFASAVILIISCMGLFGLISLNISSRSKEIGIHKVLGSSILNVIRLLSKEYFFVLLISLSISNPLCYFALQMISKEAFPFYPGWSNIPLIYTSIIIIIMSMATIFSNVFKAASVNPVEVLRKE